MPNKIKQIENFAKEKTANIIAHDFMHVNRVRNWALKIAKSEGYQDLEMVEAAALLHDIGRSIKGDHGHNSAIVTKEFLTENKLFTDNEITEICLAVKNHNKYNKGEGKILEILKDADVMDLFGAIGIMRTCASHYRYTFYDEKNVKYYTWGMNDKQINKINKYGNYDNIVDSLNFQISCSANLYTKSAKKLAKPFVEYSKNFILELEKEVEENKK